MGRKKNISYTEIKPFYSDNLIKISKDGQEWIFEIGKEVTGDVAEAVAILMTIKDKNDKIWDICISEINNTELMPIKSLFWLTGGEVEWKTMEHYNLPWADCHIMFDEEFGYVINNIVNKAKTLKDIRQMFIRKLNLPTLYEFALSKNLVK